MSDTLLSPAWYRVAELTPRLRSHARIHRHDYRGQTWYVLQDLAQERFHRFSPAAYAVIGLMDGRRTLQTIWESVLARLGDEALTQHDLIHLLSQLHAADVLQCDVRPDTAELFSRRERQQRQHWRRRLLSVLSWQLPLLDPDRLLTRCLPVLRPLLGWGGAIGWLAVVGAALLLAAAHWTDLTKNVVDQALAPRNLILLWLLFPVVKLAHELGHALMVKRFGGDVHEIGVMFLMFSPVPYVDASSSWAFPSKWHRILVGGAGMAVELVIGASALFVWASSQPGIVRTLAFNTVLIAGVSTIVFNLNPLLRFDGYYMLADFLEIPNLRARANSYLGFLCERYLFGRREAEPPPAGAGERAWFAAFAVGAFAYRALVTVAILLFLADRWFYLGMFFGVITLLFGVLVPAFKGAVYLASSPRLHRVRRRAVAVAATVIAAVVALVWLVPAPFFTRTEGVVWLPDEAVVRAGTDGFVNRVVAQPGVRVPAGALLIRCEDSTLTTDVVVLEARLREMEARHREQVPQDLVKAQIIEEERRYVEEQLQRARTKAADLLVRSRTDGTFVVPQSEDLPGRFVHKGEVLGYVVDLATITVRAVVSQDDINLIQQRTQRVDVRLAERLARPISADLQRLVPAASEQLPSPALGSEGGGLVPLDPSDTKGQKAAHTMFQVDLRLPTDVPVLNVGGRVYIRFDHGWAPFGVQWVRTLRQLFLARFNA
ncbi:MAG: HlyD family efflux transporter periplasmic adaptor subunit [Nitrospirota bacterium]|nr:HlyD family efflux transporter periplasmic adaptor subunit [Nitrospirota bacterium]